jgi:hypothetical protein
MRQAGLQSPADRECDTADLQGTVSPLHSSEDNGLAEMLSPGGGVGAKGHSPGTLYVPRSFVRIVFPHLPQCRCHGGRDRDPRFKAALPTDSYWKVWP